MPIVVPFMVYNTNIVRNTGRESEEDREARITQPSTPTSHTLLPPNAPKQSFSTERGEDNVEVEGGSHALDSRGDAAGKKTERWCFVARRGRTSSMEPAAAVLPQSSRRSAGVDAAIFLLRTPLEHNNKNSNP